MFLQRLQSRKSRKQMTIIPLQSPEGEWGWVVCLDVFVVNFLTVGRQNCAGVVYDALMEEYSTSRGETGKKIVLFSLFQRSGYCVATNFPQELSEPNHKNSPSRIVLRTSRRRDPNRRATIEDERRNSFANRFTLNTQRSNFVSLHPNHLATRLPNISTTFRILAGLQSLMLLSALTFTPVSSVTRTNQPPRNREMDFRFFRSKAYIIWVVAQCVFMVVFLVPFVHLVR